MKKDKLLQHQLKRLYHIVDANPGPDWGRASDIQLWACDLINRAINNSLKRFYANL